MIEVPAMAAKEMKVPARTKLGSEGLEVSVQGLGCSSMTGRYGAPKPEQDMIALIHHAVHSGITFLDTSDVYGPFFNELLLGKALKGIRDKVQLATKFGIVSSNGKVFCGDPDYVRASCEASLKRLDVDYIDLYYQHRVDTMVPIEVTVGAMKELVQEGKVKYIGLSEASVSTIRRAHAVHPITAVQLEWSLCSRDVEQDIIGTCRELGIGIVAYSPLCRGLLSAGRKAVESITDGVDIRKLGLPRFIGENLENNQHLYLALKELASRKGCTPGQLALAWVHHQGDDVVPIPGTTKIENFEENVAALQVNLSVRDVQEMEALFHVDAVAGDRYADMNFWGYVHAQTPPLSSWKFSC